MLKIINYSLQNGVFPDYFKISHITPIIKVKNGDKNSLSNYRPVSNTAFLAKVEEKCVLHQLQKHLRDNNLNFNRQSAYKENHSCETALLKICDDVLSVLDSETSIVMTFLDFSAAFDTIDHNILIEKLKKDYFLNGTVLKWFKSYIENRYSYVQIDGSYSDGKLVTCGVPQGTVLGPILFALYTQEVHKIIESYGLMFHMFADDMQIYTVYKGNESDLIPLNNCLNQVKLWANCNYLKLNDNKTKFLRVTSEKPRIKHLDCKLLDLEVTVFEKQVKNLGVIVDQKLSFKSQINKVCQLGYFMLKNLWRISDKISSIELRIQIIHSCIISHIDYCNSLFVNLPQCDINKLQMLMNASVRFIYSLRRSKDISITYYLKKCHFLPVKLRVNFKICVLVYKCQHESAPEYLTELLQEKDSLESLRVYKDRSLLKIENLNQLDYKNRRFSVIAPILWNNLPRETRESESLFIFKKRLKTFYFDQF